jgi:hypothetical protein
MNRLICYGTYVQIVKMHIFWEILVENGKRLVHGVVHTLDWGPDRVCLPWY